MFIVSTRGLFKSKRCLVAPDPLTEADFRSIARELGETPLVARKVGIVAARQCESRELVVTHWNGVETNAVAEPGHSIVTNLTLAKQLLRDQDGRENRYVIKNDKFRSLYQQDEGAHALGAIYKAISAVEAIAFPGGFDIMGPWGGRQRAPSGYLVLNGDQVYGNNRQTFEQTYTLAP